MFQQPAENGDKAPIPEMIGSLVLFVVHEHRTGVITAFGERDAISCDVHCLDGTHGGEVFANALLFQGALIGSLKGAAGGQPVLARIGQGIAKPGQNPPYVLNPFTDADLPVATAYWQRVQAQQFQPPNGQQEPAASPPAANGHQAPMATATPAGQMTPAQFEALPAEVRELLRQSGQAPAGV